MSHTIHFADKTLTITSRTDIAADVTIEAADGAISRAKICKILENHNTVVLHAGDEDGAFAAFAGDFTAVTAAGGVVVDGAARALMIRRNGRWDLPKGHLEEGEELTACAAREVEEETGVACEVVEPLCQTLHAYWFPRTERWELKRTHWYLLRPTAESHLVPQREEGIEQAVWCTPAEVGENLRSTFPTIRRVFEALESCRKV